MSDSTDPPPDATCIETGCTLDAVTTRVATDPWLTDMGVLVPGDVVEWVCSIHAANVGCAR